MRLFSRRLLAYGVDAVILFAGVLLTQALLATLRLNPLLNLLPRGQFFSGWQLHLWVFATVSVPFWLYYAWQQRSQHGATFGQRLLHLRVTTTDGERLSFRQALARTILMLIPFELNHIVIFYLADFTTAAPPSSAFWVGYAIVWLVIVVYIVTALLTSRQQSIHDLVAGTVVTN
jgi:uncharacterized RDD family membrane protein YckC